MNKTLLVFFLAGLCNSPRQLDEVALTGIVIKPEYTTYMYGTHTLEKDNAIQAALKSNTVNLDDFIGKTVRITGKPVEGYPLSGGPILIDVNSVKIMDN
jgi:hypothetical protein